MKRPLVRREVIGFGIVVGIILGIVISTCIENSIIVYEAEAATIPYEPKEVLIETKINWTPERIEKEIQEKAKQYGANPIVMANVIQCESNGSTTIQSLARNKNGERENSWGLVQIHLTAHTHITKEQAIDPEFAIEFLAKNITKNPYMWTCYKLIYG